MAKTFLVFPIEKYKKYLLPGLVFLGLALLVIIFYVLTTDVSKTMHSPFDVSRDRVDTCQVDSDCIVVDYDDCCSGKVAINQKYLKQYNRTPEWQVSGRNCHFANCPWTSITEEPKCVLLPDNVKRCVLSREPADGYYLENCLSKYEFIDNGECGEDCSEDKVYIFYVNDNGRFERIMEGTSYDYSNYKNVLPNTIRKQVVAVYEKRNCDDCTELFSIRESTGLAYVGVNSFCDFLYNQNLNCNDCIDVMEVDKPAEE